MINSHLPTPNSQKSAQVSRLGVGSWVLGSLALALGVSASASAQWPQWRGPGGLGISAEKNLPTEWQPATADKPAVNIKWTTEIPGRGHSSPIVAGNLVFVTTSIKGAEVPGRKAPVHLNFDYTPGYVHPDAVDIEFKEALKVLAIDANTGKVAWERTAYDGVMFDDRHRKNTYASPTMVTDGEHVYASFESAGLYVYDLKGNPAWKKDLGTIIKAGLGPGTSPVLYKNLIILQCDQEMGTGSHIIALDKKTGDEVWRADRTTRRSWATPLIVNTGSRDELIASGAEMVISYDPATGKELWRANGTQSHPIPSPVATKGLVFLSAGSQAKVVMAMKPGGSGNLKDSKDLLMWRYNKGAAYVPSPIAIGDYLYLLSDAGLMTCIDAVTGERKYEGGRVPVPATFFASPVAFEDKILLTSEDGDSFVIEAGPVHKVLQTNTVGEPVYASPAIANGTIYIRGDKHLFAIRKQ
jgi:outer membrane protein assembly factor BamB